MDPFLFVPTPLGWEPDVMEPQGAHIEHEKHRHGYERWHNVILSCDLPDVLLLTVNRIGREEKLLHTIGHRRKASSACKCTD